MADIAKRLMQVGIESTYGTGVAATRRWYGRGNIQHVGPDPTLVNEDRASYDAYARASVPVLTYDWGFEGGLDLDDMVEVLGLAVDGSGVSPTGVGPYTWNFTPNDTLDSATVEWDSSGQVWEASGCMVNTMALAGTAAGGDVTMTLAGPAQDRTTASLTSLSDHTTNVIQGWELKLFIDALGATPGTTEITTTIISWGLELSNGLERNWRGDNTRYIAKVARGRRMITGNLLMELNASSLTQITNLEAVTEQLIRLQLGNNVDAGGANYQMDIDIPCALRLDTIEDDAEQTVVNMEFTSLYDSTNAFAYDFTVVNARAS